MSEKKAETPRKNIHQRWLEVMRACRYIQKDGYNTAQKFGFLSDEATAQKVSEALLENGLATWLVNAELLETTSYTTKGGGENERVKVRITVEVVDVETGESKIIKGIGEGADGQDKACNKANTSARKYMWRLALNMATGDDADGVTIEPAVSGPVFMTGNVKGQPLARAEDNILVAYLEHLKNKFVKAEEASDVEACATLAVAIDEAEAELKKRGVGGAIAAAHKKLTGKAAA